MGKRLKSGGGFTLIEVLCAFLILSLSAAVLFTGIGAASSMNAAARTGRAELYGELAVAEAQANGSAVGDGTVFFYRVDAAGEAVGAPFGSRTVHVFEEDDGALRSYQLIPGSS